MKLHKRTLKLLRIYTHGNWFYLFHALIVLLVIYPYVEQSNMRHGPWILYLLNTFVIVAIVYETSFTRLQLILAFIFGFVILALYWTPTYIPTALAQFILHSILYIYAIIMVLRSLTKVQKADTETVYGTISLYILLGLFWTNIYQIIALTIPGAFTFTDPSLEKTLNWSDYLYYSFITLTTVGYGDIVPLAPQARSTAILEATTGVLFIAVMVSKTIGLYVVELRNRSKEEENKLKETK